MVGLSRSITLSFMVVGHTKFTPDSCFGLVKQWYQKTHVECLSDIVDIVNNFGYINHARLVYTQDGQVLVQCTTSRHISLLTLRRYQKSKGSINSYFQQIIQERSIICKLYSDSEETKLDVRVNPLW